MTSPATSPSKILAVADASNTQIALKTAAALAATHGATLEIVACFEPPHDLTLLSRVAGRTPDKLLDEAMERTRDMISTRIAQVMRTPTPLSSFLIGKAYREIIGHVAASGCDFVVKAVEPLSAVDRFLFASTDQHLLRACPCPVWLQTPTAPHRPKRVMAAIDLDMSDAAEPETLMALNRRVLDAACAIADGPDAQIIVLHGWDAPAEGFLWAFSGQGDAQRRDQQYVNAILDARQREMDRFLAEIRAANSTSPPLVPVLPRGAAEAVIQEQSAALKVDVVVMGTVARTGLSGMFIGNTAENIINSLECPILAVKPDGFVSPLLRN